jgi:hypothetical protein
MRWWGRPLVAVAAVVCLGTSAARVRSQAPTAFAVAIVGDDGVLVPVARFDEGTWERIWRGPGKVADVPATLDAVPRTWYPPDGAIPAEWFLWLVDDPQVVLSPFDPRAARRVSIARPIVVKAACLDQVGLQTDYRGPGTEAGGSSNRPKAGLALTTAAVRVEQATKVDPASAVAQPIAGRARLSFHRAEEEQIEVLEPAHQKLVPPFKERRALPVTWTSMVRLGATQAPSKTYYLEGEVRYGSIVMSGHVWMQMDGTREVTDAEVMITDADREAVRHRVPLGILRVGDRRFWVFQTAQHGRESYETVEVGGQGQRPLTLLEVAGGGCEDVGSRK